MNETTITTQIMKKWQAANPNRIWFHKIGDPAVAGSISAQRAVDIIGCFDGVLFAMEWKIKKNNRSFPFKKIRMNQIETLCDVSIAGGLGMIVIATYVSTKEKYIHAIPISIWNKTINNYVKTSTQKSINIEKHFDSCRIECRKSGNRDVWDMSSIETELNNLRG